MKPSHSNAFREPNRKRTGRTDTKQLSHAALAAMTAVLCETDFGWSLRLSPMRAFDALRIWSSLTDAPDACSLLYDVKLDESIVVARRSSRMAQRAASRQPMTDLADHLGIPVIDQFDGDMLALDELSLRELVGLTSTGKLKCVLVEGPVESRDADAISRVSRAGKNPLAAEVRAVAALSVKHDRHITLETRTRRQAISLVSENFRHYLAAICDRPSDEFTTPEDWQIERLLDITGSLIVRPIETDVFSTSIDVGISTATWNESGDIDRAGAADRSLIYDVPSRTWHDEP